MDWNQPRGAVLSLGQCWRLARAWYGPDRRSSEWRRFSPAEAEAVFIEAGLSGPFWSIR
jgi:hypothetical protein